MIKLRCREHIGRVRSGDAPAKRFETPVGATTLVVEISGEIDIANAREVFNDLVVAVSPQRPHLVVDARSLTFLDSAGIAMLLRVLAHVRAIGGSLHVVAEESTVCRVIALLGLTGRLGRLASLEAALACAERDCLASVVRGISTHRTRCARWHIARPRNIAT